MALALAPIVLMMMINLALVLVLVLALALMLPSTIPRLILESNTIPTLPLMMMLLRKPPLLRKKPPLPRKLLPLPRRQLSWRSKKRRNMLISLRLPKRSSQK